MAKIINNIPGLEINELENESGKAEISSAGDNVCIVLDLNCKNDDATCVIIDFVCAN